MRALLMVVMITGLPFATCQPNATPVTSNPECTADPCYGVTAEVTDAASGMPLMNGFTLTITDGSYSEVLQQVRHYTEPPIASVPMNTFRGALGRPGTYTLTLEGTGHHVQPIEPIVVTGEQGHVQPVTVQIKVQLDPYGCNDVSLPGVAVTVTDAITGKFIQNPVLTLTSDDIQDPPGDDPYAQMLQPFGYTGQGEIVSFKGAEERAGSYMLEAAAPGYKTQFIRHILVLRGICSVQQVKLDVQLQPEP